MRSAILWSDDDSPAAWYMNLNSIWWLGYHTHYFRVIYEIIFTWYHIWYYIHMKNILNSCMISWGTNFPAWLGRLGMAAVPPRPGHRDGDSVESRYIQKSDRVFGTVDSDQLQTKYSPFSGRCPAAARWPPRPRLLGLATPPGSAESRSHGVSASASSSLAFESGQFSLKNENRICTICGQFKLPFTGILDSGVLVALRASLWIVWCRWRWVNFDFS